MSKYFRSGDLLLFIMKISLNTTTEHVLEAGKVNIFDILRLILPRDKMFHQFSCVIERVDKISCVAGIDRLYDLNKESQCSCCKWHDWSAGWS